MSDETLLVEPTPIGPAELPAVASAGRTGLVVALLCFAVVLVDGAISLSYGQSNGAFPIGFFAVRAVLSSLLSAWLFSSARALGAFARSRGQDRAALLAGLRRLRGHFLTAAILFLAALALFVLLLLVSMLYSFVH
jgi:hypothetical protein